MGGAFVSSPLCWISAVLLALLPLVAAADPASPLRPELLHAHSYAPDCSHADDALKPARPTVFAVYYAWYHDGAHPQRPWLHWTRPAAAKNLLALQAQRPGEPAPASAARPLVGLYDSADPTIARWHVQLAKAAGIDAFLVSWWDKHNGVDQNFQRGIFPAAEKEGFKIALFDERAQFHDTLENYQRMLTRALRRYKDSPAYVASIASSSIGPVRSLLAYEGKTGCSLPLAKAAEELAVFIAECRAAFPGTQIGLITNFPNWHYTPEHPGMLGGYTQKSGVHYLDALEAVWRAAERHGTRFDFVEVDCPFNYYRATANRDDPSRRIDNAAKFKALQRWCEDKGIGFWLVVNFDTNPQNVAEKAELGNRLFHDNTLAYIRRLHQDGVFPDCCTIQSWYKLPETHLPEEGGHSFMHTARDAIRLIRQLYPCSDRRDDEEEPTLGGIHDRRRQSNRAHAGPSAPQSFAQVARGTGEAHRPGPGCLHFAAAPPERLRQIRKQ